jgi:dimethylargininase
MRAITRAVGPTLAQCELTFRAREPIDTEKAAAQHRAYCQVLERAGIAVEVLPADEHLPDAVFVEDAAVVLDEVAVMARPGTPTRREEVPAIAAALARYRNLSRIEAPGTLEGGDVLRIGRECYVGLSTRTNREGAQQLAAIVHPLGYRVTPIAVHGCLHLKTAVTAIDEGALLVSPRWIETEPLRKYKRLEVPLDEPCAANVLTVGGIVHVSARCPQTRRLLEKHRFRTEALDISEFEKAEAGLTCLSLLIAVKDDGQTA